MFTDHYIKDDNYIQDKKLRRKLEVSSSYRRREDRRKQYNSTTTITERKKADEK